MIHKLNPAPGSVKDIDVKGRYVQAYVSSWDVDSEGDQFVPGAWKKSVRERGPKGTNRVRVLYMHQFYEPIATPKEVSEDETGLLFGFSPGHTARGNDVMVMYDEGIIAEHSVGFDLVEARSSENDHGGLDIKEAVLWEGSPVTWGANENTPVVNLRSLADQMAAVEKALRGGTWRTDEVPRALEMALAQWRTMLVSRMKGAVSYQNLPLAERGAAWDAVAARKRIAAWAGGPAKDDVDWGKYRKAFLWYDAANAEAFGAYKLPIADVIDGGLKAVPRGVFAAAGVIQGARGGANIPEADVAAIKTHLGKYYARLDAEPPWKSARAPGSVAPGEGGAPDPTRQSAPLAVPDFDRVRDLLRAAVAARKGA